MPTTTPTAPSTPAAPVADASKPSLVEQGTALAAKAANAQKAVALTWLDAYDKNTRVVLGAGETIADKTPITWVADALRKQNALAARLTSGYSEAVRAYVS